MSVIVSALVWERSDAKSGALTVLLAIADNAKDNGTAWPSIEHLAKKTRLTQRGTQYALQQLLASDELELIRRGGKHTGSNVYRVNTQSLRAKTSRFTEADDPEVNTQSATVNTKSATVNTKPTSSKPSKEPSKEPASSAGADDEAASPPQSPLDEQVTRLCQLMSDQVRATHDIAASSSRGRVAKTWLGACRGLLTVDSYTPKQVEYAIAWVNRHQYWRHRIQSMTRLRAEMPEVAGDIRRTSERNQQRVNGDQLAGYSKEQRARIERTAARLGKTVEQFMAEQRQTNPTQEAGHDDHHHTIAAARPALPPGEGPGARPVAQAALASV